MPSSVARTLARKLTAAGVEVQRSKRSALGRAALAVKVGTEASIRRVVPDLRMSGVGRGGARVGVRYDVRGDDQAVVRATGPLHLVERPTKPHGVQPRSRRARGKRAAVRLADGGVRAKVRHPGTAGQAPFAKGVEASTPKATKELRRATSSAVVRGIRA